ncbi:hypothetical protein F5051DRAFT_447538, partial [Lentinula edodes]
RPSSRPAPRDLPSRVPPFSRAYTLETHSHTQPIRFYFDVLASTTPTTQYRTVPHSSSTFLRLRDLSGPLRNPLKGHHLLPSSSSLLLARYNINFPIPKPTPRPILTQVLQATARSQRGTSPSEVSVSPRRPVVEISKKSKGKGKAKAQPVDEDPDDGDDDVDEKEPCERCRTKKISCQMQAGKRSSIICKPCHDAKVRCSYSGRPSTVKREGGSNPTGERLAVLESQVAQLLADNRQLRDGQVKANTYHCHFNCKLDWLITDAARRRRSPPELPEAGPSGSSRKRRRVVDSDEEEAREIEERAEQEVEKDGEGEEEEMEEEEPAPVKAQSEKGKERAE